jgi:hypothetical protein
MVVATKTKTKAGVRTGKGKGGGRRPPVKVKSGPDVPLLPIVVGGILLVALIGMIVYVLYNNKPTTPAPTAGGVPCDSLEHSQTHYHAALQIIYQGAVTPLPGNAGILTDSAGNPTCFYWLHVHAGQQNVIHIEAPKGDTFTLGQFFDVWSAWNQKQNQGGAEKLDSTHVAQFALAPDQKLVIYIDLQDGKGPQPYTGDPRTIQLKSHEVITLEITPPEVNPPPSFTFASGL